MSVLRIRSCRRYAVRSEAKLKAKGQRARRCLLIELSQMGARISGLGKHSLSEGDQISLETDHARPIKAVVSWSDENRAGLRLTQPLHLNELSDFVASARKAIADQAQVA